MTPATWVVVGSVALLLGTAFGVMAWRAWKGTHVEWVQVPGHTAGVRCFVEGDTDLQLIAEALRAAQRMLLLHTGWPPITVDMIFSEVNVYVLAVDKWTDAWGRTVAGLDPDGPNVVVGRSLAALCHEMAHQCEQSLFRRRDDSHVSWNTNGIYAAINEYEAWLAARKLGPTAG